MKLPSVREELSFLILRVTMGIIFITHGTARLIFWSVPNFGDFLDSKGFLPGTILAWIITVGEIIGGFLLVIGYKLKFVVVFHFMIISAGLFLVHLQNGWFVVGHGQGGIEYSVLILAVLLFLYSRDASSG